MEWLTIPLTMQKNLLVFCEKVTGLKLYLEHNILFPHCVFINDHTYPDIHPEKFILIFDFKLNYNQRRAAEIKYFQIPKHLRHHGCAKKIYYLLEHQLKELGCQEITVEALSEGTGTIGFWEHLNFKKSEYCFVNDDVCPMIKHL